MGTLPNPLPDTAACDGAFAATEHTLHDLTDTADMKMLRNKKEPPTMTRTYRGTAQVRAGDLREGDVIQLRMETGNRAMAWVQVQEMCRTPADMDAAGLVTVDRHQAAGYLKAGGDPVGVLLVRVEFTDRPADRVNWVKLRGLDLVPIQYDITIEQVEAGW